MPDLNIREYAGSKKISKFSIAALSTKGAVGFFLRLLAPLADRMLGLRRFQACYERNGLPGLERYAFLERLIEAEHIRYTYDKTEFDRIPRKGPVIIVANHPMGGLEGIILMLLLRQVRTDYKFFVNIIDSFIVELHEFFIFTNPMARGSLTNHTSLRLSREWLSAGHCLVVFPAGRVGIYSAEKGYVTDEPWDEIASRLGIRTGADFVPIFFEGECSKFFSTLSRYIYPMKLFLLGWEFLKSFKKRVTFHVGRPITASRLAACNRAQATAWLRMRTYLECPPACAEPEQSGNSGWSARVLALVEAVLALVEAAQLARLDSRQHNAKRKRGVLHPEVEDYIARYGLTDRELEELAEALDGKPATIDALMNAYAMYCGVIRQ